MAEGIGLSPTRTRCETLNESQKTGIVKIKEFEQSFRKCDDIIE